MHAENRKSPRQEVNLPAEVEFGDGIFHVDCVIWDWSDHGARLTLPVSLGLADVFTLRLQGSDDRQCRVVWRSDEQVGVEFLASVVVPLRRP